jgi:endoglucanase
MYKQFYLMNKVRFFIISAVLLILAVIPTLYYVNADVSPNFITRLWKNHQIFTEQNSNTTKPVALTEVEKNKILYKFWDNYKTEYIDAKYFRTIDKQQNNITTSEGQAYSMFISSWLGDKLTFENSWNWTKDNLKRSGSNSFGWKWGLKSDGSYGLLTDIGGDNTATDADIDMAYSLLIAHKKWDDKENKYLKEAQLLIADIWKNEVILTQNGRYVLAANNLEKLYNKRQIVVNPSYISPYAFREFAKIDPANNWEQLVTDSYYLLNLNSDTNVGKGVSTGLPSDWILLNVDTFTIILPDGKTTNLTANYGYDAARVTWRVGFDYKLNNSPDALQYLNKLEFLKNEYENNGIVKTVYSHNGLSVGNYESMYAYGTSLGYFSNLDQKNADKIFVEKIQPVLKENEKKFALSYYDSNWTWFGVAQYFNIVPDI